MLAGLGLWHVSCIKDLNHYNYFLLFFFLNAIYLNNFNLKALRLLIMKLLKKVKALFGLIRLIWHMKPTLHCMMSSVALEELFSKVRTLMMSPGCPQSRSLKIYIWKPDSPNWRQGVWNMWVFTEWNKLDVIGCFMGNVGSTVFEVRPILMTQSQNIPASIWILPVLWVPQLYVGDSNLLEYPVKLIMGSLGHGTDVKMSLNA